MENNQQDTALNEDNASVLQTQQAPQPQSNSGLAIAGMVLGIVGIATSFLPIINNMSFILGIIGLILSIVGILGVNKGKKKGRGFAVAGIVLNIVTVVIVLVSQAFYSAALDAAANSMKAQPASTSQQSNADSNSSADSNSNSNQATSSDSAYIITIDDARIVTSRYGDRVIVVTYTFTNNSTKDAAFFTAISDKAYQNGVELESAFDSSSWNSGNDETKTLKTGSSITIEQGFKLVDSSPVTVEVKEIFDFSDTLLAEATFEIA